MKRKLNNKGNTLAIVLIGIFILSILGTLILGLTATNFKMKVNDKKNETTFYYAEKAVDELYAGLGSEVMNAVNLSYTDVIEKYVKIGATSDNQIANNMFCEELRDRLSTLYVDYDINKPALYMDNTAALNAMFSRLSSGNYIEAVSGYDFTLYSPTNSATQIEYYKDVPGSSSLQKLLKTSGETIKDIDVIMIKNVGIRCESSSSGYSSSIVTDFKIDVPDITVDFADSQSAGTIDDLLQYSLISEGANMSGIQNDQLTNTTIRNKSAINVEKDAKVTLSGNIYANGTAYALNSPAEQHVVTMPNGSTQTVSYYKENKSSVIKNNNSISIGEGATLNINSKILNCINDFVLDTSASSTLRNRSGAAILDDINTLQFYVKNIKTIGGEAGKGAKLDVAGNCIVKDDMEINGNYSEVKLAGNYFGYGLRGTKDTANNTYLEDDTSALNALGLQTSGEAEHEKSSAILINGTNASVDMTGIEKLILAGRAYIDLDGTGTNKSYMTGESISFKGNQNMYLADEELSESKIAGDNPIKESDLLARANKSNISEINISTDLGIKDEYKDKIVAKQIGSDIYFYVKNANPINQTNYVSTAFNNPAKQQNLLEQVRKLAVKSFAINQNLLSYTVGTIMTAQSNGTSAEVTPPISGANGITQQDFVKTLNSIDNRKENLVPFLKDLSEKYVLGDNFTIVAPESNGNNDSVYEYYIDREKVLDISTVNTTRTMQIQGLNGGPLTSMDALLTANGLDTLQKQQDFVNEIKACLPADFDYVNNKVGYSITNEGGSTPAEIEITAGVIIAEKSCKISKDFTGLIICKNEIYLAGNDTNIESNVALAKLLFSKLSVLQSVINPNISISGVTGDTDVVKADNLKYTDLVTKTNWRKDTN